MCLLLNRSIGLYNVGLTIPNYHIGPTSRLGRVGVLTISTTKRYGGLGALHMHTTITNNLVWPRKKNLMQSLQEGSSPGSFLLKSLL